MMEQIFYIIVNTTKPLYTIIYSTRYFFIDYWSFVHLFNGFLLMYYFLWAKYKHPFIILLSILFLWEVTELLFTYIAIRIFNPEILPDQVTDIVIGMLGGGLSWCLLGRKRGKLRLVSEKYSFTSLLVIRIFVATAMALIWVGYHGYKYNISFLNSSSINWFALLLWSAWLFITISMYNFIYFLVKNNILSLVLTWIIYLPLLLLVEYLGYYVLKIRLVTNDGPLIFGLIHGSKALKTFYLTAGIVAILLTNLLTMVFASRLSPKSISNLWDVQNKDR